MKNDVIRIANSMTRMFLFTDWFILARSSVAGFATPIIPTQLSSYFEIKGS